MADDMLIPLGGITKERAVTAALADEDGAMEALLAQLESAAREKVRELGEIDTARTKDRQALISAAAMVTRSKTALSDITTEINSRLKAQMSRVADRRKLAEGKLSALAVEIRQPVTDWEQADEARKAAHLARIGEISRIAPADGAEGVRAQIDALAQIDCEAFEEFCGEAAIAREAALGRLETALRMIEAAERLAAERAEAEERERKAKAEAEAQRLAVERAAAEQMAAMRAQSEAMMAQMQATIAQQQAQIEALLAALPKPAQPPATPAEPPASAEPAATPAAEPAPEAVVPEEPEEPAVQDLPEAVVFEAQPSIAEQAATFLQARYGISGGAAVMIAVGVANGDNPYWMERE